MTSIISTDESHVTFARALASPDKEIRDKTVKSLINYVSTLQEITELEMLKLWKALYYCMWLSDKAPIQMELALALSGLFRSFKNMDFAVMFYRLFFRTMIREWTLLDQHRINKFYTLIRLMLREGLSFMYKNGWSAESVDSLLDVLEEEVLVKTPNGLRLHIADIFLQELLTASNGDINSDAFMRVLRPFFAAVQGCLDKSFQERVILKVFSAFVTDHAREHRGSDETVTEARKHLFLNVQTSIVQSMIFSTASDSDTLEKNRRRIYTLHQEFPPVTGLPFASMDEIEDTEEMQIEIEKEEKVAVKSVNKEVNGSSSSSKKAVKAVAVSHKLENEIVVEKEVVKVSKKRTAEVESDEKNQKVPRKDINPVATSSASSKSAEVVPAVAEVEKKKKVEDKRKEVAAPLPVANMVAVPSPAARAAEATTTAVAAPFIESKRFTGGKLGYVFKKVRAD